MKLLSKVREFLCGSGRHKDATPPRPLAIDWIAAARSLESRQPMQFMGVDLAAPEPGAIVPIRPNNMTLGRVLRPHVNKDPERGLDPQKVSRGTWWPPGFVPPINLNSEEP